MRHIEFPNGQQPPVDGWLKKAQELTDQLQKAHQIVLAAGTPEEKAAAISVRNKIIDDNDCHWGKIKEWLMTFSGDKCWFTEAKDGAGHYHVEHFRPKKEAKELDKASPARDGYWWLAFDFKNYRLCGSVTNPKKGTFFPLHLGTLPASGPASDYDDETPLLIDPIRDEDVALITFVEGGRAEPATPNPPGGWDHDRAKYSIERYSLNDHPPLERGRETVWKTCSTKLDELENLVKEVQEAEKLQVPPSPSRRQKINTVRRQIKDMTKFESPYSAVARAFLFQDPREWARKLVA